MSTRAGNRSEKSALHRSAGVLDDVRMLEQARYQDSRGPLQKVLCASQCDGCPPRGEVYVSAANPGEAKGNHYRRHMGEWFAVVQGHGSLELCVLEAKARRSIDSSESSPRTTYVPPEVAHAVVNRGRDVLICIAWAEAEYDPSNVIPFSVWPEACL